MISSNYMFAYKYMLLLVRRSKNNNNNNENVLFLNVGCIVACNKSPANIYLVYYD